MHIVREDCFSKYINYRSYIARPLLLNYEGTHLKWRDTRYEVGERVRGSCNSHFNPIVILRNTSKGNEGWYGLMTRQLYRLIIKSTNPLEMLTAHFDFVSVRVGKAYPIEDYERELIAKLPRINKIDKLLN